MNTMTKRLAWKETALLRPICIVSLILMAMILFAGFATINSGKDYTEFVGNLLMGLSGVVGLAFGILLFVFEREAGTDSFLECFPVDGRTVAKIKLTQTVKYFLTFIVAALLLGGIALAAYDGGFPRFEGKSAPGLWISLMVLIPIQCLLWALICSLTFRSSLHATIASAFLTVVSTVGLGIFATGWTYRASSFNDTQTLVGAYAALVAVLAGAVWYLSPTWLRGNRRASRTWGRTARVGKTQSQSAATASSLADAPSMKCAYPYRALLWQNVRRCWVPWLALAAGLLVLSFLLGLQMTFSLRNFGHFGPALGMRLWTRFLFVAAGAAIGMLMFSGDQSKSNFLFFQHQADYPRRIWLSRLTIFLAFIPIVIAAALLANPDPNAYLHSVDFNSLRSNDPIRLQLEAPTVINNITAFVLTAAAAQLTTLTIRIGAGFVAFILTVVSSFILYQLFGEMVEANGFTPIFIGPFIIACFVATWWFAPRWISRRWAKTSATFAYAACGLVLAGSISGWIWYRANEFQSVPRTESWTAFFHEADSIDLADANLYDIRSNQIDLSSAAALKSAYKRLKDSEAELRKDFPYGLSANQLQEYFAANEVVLEEIAENLKDPNCGLFLNPSSRVERETQKKRLRLALAAATRHHLESEDIDAALDSLVAELRAAWWISANDYIDNEGQACKLILNRILDWANTEGNDEQLIRKAISQIHELELAVFAHDSEVLYREAIFEIERAFDRQSGSKQLHVHDFPWEVERSRRWNLMQVEYFSFWESVCSTPGDPDIPLKVFNGYGHQSNTYVADPKTFVCEQPLQGSRVMQMARLRNYFRYTKVRLALAGWKLKHGSYPITLVDLCGGKDPFFAEMPGSFFSGKNFVYSGKGLDRAVFFTPDATSSFSLAHQRWLYEYQQEAPVPQTHHWIKEKTPFLLPWSGVIGLKRPMVRRLVDDDGILQAEETVEYAYWLPNGNAGYELRKDSNAYQLK